MTYSPEQFPEEKDGVRWLKMLGREDAIGKQIVLSSGQTLLAEDFTDICPGGIVDLMYGLEYAEPDDPGLPAEIQSAQEKLAMYIGPKPNPEINT